MSSLRPRLLSLLLPTVAAGAFVAAGTLRRSPAGRPAADRVRPIPRDRWPEGTLALLLEGYQFIPRRCKRLDSDLFQTRLMLQRAICLRGEEWARLFYDPAYFCREGAAPRRLQKTLFGRPGIQAMDGEPHRHRKKLFMEVMSPERIADLRARTATGWREASRSWLRADRVVLFDEAREVLCKAVCAWAGVPLSEEEVVSRADDLEAMIDSSGRVGPRHLQGRLARRRAERWIADLVGAVRAGRLDPSPGQALHAFSWYRGTDGNLLHPQGAAVELLNVLRPTVAVARFVVFLALALHRHPEWRERLAAGAGEEDLLFVQEVRRFYPFFPFVAARTRQTFEWQGFWFPAGVRVLLDLYGTNRHPGIWGDADDFRPERFRAWQENPFDFIPQGGGDTDTGHRCAGEKATIELMVEALSFLTRSVRYEVPAQDLSVSLRRMPAIPRSRFMIRVTGAAG